MCDALGSGDQSIIMRKGGIHEGGGGFSFDHSQFAMFPTLFHEQQQHLRTRSVNEEHLGQEHQPGDKVFIRYWATLSSVWNLGDWKTIERIEPFHIWKRATIRERFEWSKSSADSPGIKMALVRIYRLEQPWQIEYQRNHGGCRSWLTLPEIFTPPRETCKPVLSEDEFSKIREGLEEIAGLPTH